MSETCGAWQAAGREVGCDRHRVDSGPEPSVDLRTRNLKRSDPFLRRPHLSRTRDRGRCRVVPYLSSKRMFGVGEVDTSLSCRGRRISVALVLAQNRRVWWTVYLRVPRERSGGVGGAGGACELEKLPDHLLHDRHRRVSRRRVDATTESVTLRRGSRVSSTVTPLSVCSEQVSRVSVTGFDAPCVDSGSYTRLRRGPTVSLNAVPL